MRRVLIWVSITIVGLLQIIQAILGVATQAYEAKSDFNLILLTFATLAPFLCSLYILDSIKLPANRLRLEPIIALAVTAYTVCNACFSLYRIGRKFSLDLFWVWYNIADVYPTLAALDEWFPYYLCAVAVAIALHYFGLIHIFSSLRRTAARQIHIGSKHFSRLGAWGGSLLLAGALVWIDNEPKNVVFQAIKPTPQATRIYLKYYEDSLIQNKSNLPSGENSQTDRNLFFMHLESLNAQFVKPAITPNLLRYGVQDGVLFRQILAPSVLTIRSQETILCSVLPALKQNIATQRDLMEGLVCLPKIMKQRGFKTLYFHSYPSIKFANRDVFMKVIGFDEFHAADVMKPGDKLLSWGYPEDIFYQRVFEFLERYRGHKIFAYIGINTSNHFPFYDEEKKKEFSQFRSTVPFLQSKTLSEKIANTTFIQDQFFGDMYRKFFENDYSKNSHMVAFGDHSWPIGRHANNFYGENYAFQENFVTSLAIIPAAPDRQRYKIGTQIERLQSYLDLLPTLLEMYGISGLRFYGQSFLGDTLVGGQAKQDRCAIAVQPFSGGYIATINYPWKHIFKIADNTVTTYDLSQDPNELSPLTTKRGDFESLKVLEDCLRSLKP